MDIEAAMDSHNPSDSGHPPPVGHLIPSWICLLLMMVVLLPLILQKNWGSVVAQFFSVIAWVALLWIIIGYSLVFAPGGEPTSAGWSFLGDSRYLLFQGVDSTPNVSLAPYMSQDAFAVFQLILAVTPVILVWSALPTLEPMFSLVFLGAWLLLVYVPVCHGVWSPDGVMSSFNPYAPIQAIDGYGGAVIEMTAGFSALAIALIFSSKSTTLRTSLAYSYWCFTMLSRFPPFEQGFIAMGIAVVVWAVTERIFTRRNSLIGLVQGALAGLVATMAGGIFITDLGAGILGVIAGLVPCLVAIALKPRLNFGTIDLFSVHGIGGLCGFIAVGFLADADNSPYLTTLSAFSTGTMYRQQILAAMITILVSVIGTAVIAYPVKVMAGLRTKT